MVDAAFHSLSLMCAATIWLSSKDNMKLVLLGLQLLNFLFQDTMLKAITVRLIGEDYEARKNRSIGNRASVIDIRRRNGIGHR